MRTARIFVWVCFVGSNGLVAAPPNPPAEELRLNTFQFREWLRSRGLTEVLDLHLREFPPTDPTATPLLRREYKLSEFADARRSTEERRAALAEANEILSQLIGDFPDDPRSLQWRYTLAYSLIYDQGEPHATTILFFGGGAEDRKSLAEFAGRSLETVRSLAQRLSEELARIDRLSKEEFEEVERRGTLEQLDRLSPSADYLLIWALFYDALVRDDNDPLRARELHEIVEMLEIKPAFLQTPQERSGIQVPALVLAGMTERRLNDTVSARDFLERALSIAERLSDAAQKERIRWAVTLAAVERVRADRDDGRLDQALAGTARLREMAGASNEDSFAVRLASALLEKSIHRLETVAAEKAGRLVEASTAKEQAWTSLRRLIADFPDRKDAVYATVFSQLGVEADPAGLDPIERSALIAGLLGEAERDPSTATKRLTQAAQIGERIVSGATDSSRWLVPESLVQLGRIRLRLGDSLAAAMKFHEAARDYPRSAVSLAAATWAVQLSAELCGDSTRPDRAVVCKLYRESLDALLGHHAGTEAAKYWRFFRAQLLDELGEFDEAVTEYARVDESHEHFLESGLLRVRACAKGLEAVAARENADSGSLSERADSILAAVRSFSAVVETIVAGGGGSPEGAAEARSLLADAKLIAAEAMVAPRVNRPAPAIELVSDADEKSVSGKTAAMRVWRVRVLAHEAMGRMEPAVHAVAELVAIDPANAGPLLESMYESFVVEGERARSAGDSDSAARKADLSLLLAEKIMEWGMNNDPVALGKDRRSLRVQLAEATLRAGYAQRAGQLFEAIAREGPAGANSDASDMLASLGQAESLFQQDRFAEALPTFAKLATSLPADHPLRWKSLLRDLQCRTRLEHPHQGVLKVLAQQRFLYPDMGGPELSDSFEQVRMENEKRRDGG